MSSAFTVTWDVCLELSKDAFETVGACVSNCGGGGDCPEQGPQAFRAGMAPQEKDNAYSLQTQE